VNAAWRKALAALRHRPRLAREIALALLVKAVLLTVLFHALARGPAPHGAAAQERAAQHLLGAPAHPREDADEH
jgi:hypothetical protein